MINITNSLFESLSIPPFLSIQSYLSWEAEFSVRWSHQHCLSFWVEQSGATWFRFIGKNLIFRLLLFPSLSLRKTGSGRLSLEISQSASDELQVIFSLSWLVKL